MDRHFVRLVPTMEDEMIEEQETSGLINNTERMLVGVKNDDSESSEKLLEEVTDDKLQESLALLLNDDKICLLDKFLLSITNPMTRSNLIGKTKNEVGDFLIHIAARNNLTELLALALEFSNPNEKNFLGETALHLAADGGCIEGVKLLMSHDEIEVDSTDILNNTPLHLSVKARFPKVEIVSLLASAYLRKRKANSGDNSVDSNGKISLSNVMGRTPLHVAAIHMSSNLRDTMGIIGALQALDPNTKDNDEETALHIAARMGNFVVLEAMLEVFYGLHKDVYRHVKDKDGYSLLDICAMKADSEMVTLLIDYGANPRDGVLFHIVSESVQVPEKAMDLVKVYRTIVDQADKWSRFGLSEDKMFKTVFRPIVLENKRHYLEYISENIVNLLTQREKSNLSNCPNVIEHAIDEGAVSMLEAILHTKHLYEKRRELNVANTSAIYENVSYSNKYRFNGCIKDNGGCCGDKNIGCNLSCLLGRIVNRRDDEIVARMLNIQPILSVANGYANFARVFYGLLALAQIIYMTCFTIYHIPNTCRFEVGRGAKYNECNTTNTTALYYMNYFSDMYASKSATCAYVIWPVLLLASGILVNIQDFREQNKQMFWMNIWAYSFPIIAIVWLCIFQYPVPKYDSHVACTAIVFIIGWFHVFYYISFFERFNVFNLLLREIILKDVLNFILLMVILLIGFSCAIVSLHQTPTPGKYSNRSLTETAYTAFFDTLSPGQTFLDETTNTGYESPGTRLHLLRLVVVTYEILAFVILMNILIAMMSDTYNKESANAKFLSHLCLVRSVINLKSWWNFGRRIDSVCLDAEVVSRIIGHHIAQKETRSSSQKIYDWLTQSRKPKPKQKVTTPLNSLMHSPQL